MMVMVAQMRILQREKFKTGYFTCCSNPASFSSWFVDSVAKDERGGGSRGSRGRRRRRGRGEEIFRGGLMVALEMRMLVTMTVHGVVLLVWEWWWGSLLLLEEVRRVIVIIVILCLVDGEVG